MKYRLDRELKEKVAEAARAEDLMERGDMTQALQLFGAARAEARKRGMPHGTISWRLCIVHDNLDNLEEAFLMAIEAVDQDPLSAPFRRSFEIVATELRDKLGAPGREPADPSTPRIYRLLTENDAADDRSHLAMAVFLLQSGDAAGARRLLDALTVLSPNCVGAWRLLGEVAGRAGDEELAQRCEFERIALENAMDSTPIAPLSEA